MPRTTIDNGHFHFYNLGASKTESADGHTHTLDVLMNETGRADRHTHFIGELWWEIDTVQNTRTKNLN